jgi:serpin B
MEMKNNILVLCLLAIPSLMFGSGYKANYSDYPTSKVQTPPDVPEYYFQDAVNQFSDALFLASNTNTGNSMISPVSVFLALAMTANGAEGQTKEKMVEVLTGKTFSVEVLNDQSKTYLDSIEKLDDSLTMEIANSIWLNKNLEAGKQFLQTNETYYGSSVDSLDFSKIQSLQTINSWVKTSTNGTIDSILDSLDPGMMMYLINAMYFKADWKTPFEASSTRDNTFYTTKGEVVTPFMQRTGSFLYGIVPQGQAVVLPYSKERFAFVAMIPDAEYSLSQWLDSQQDFSLSKLFNSLVANSSPTRLALSIPKFESRYTDSLANELKGMGMGIAFDSQLADFSSMTEAKTQDIVLDEILHKTFIRVDEKGSEAAAVTAVMMRATSMPIASLPLKFDRPFLYAIMDLQEGIPLFIGILENPEKH